MFSVGVCLQVRGFWELLRELNYEVTSNFFSHVPYYIKRLNQVQRYLEHEMQEFSDLEKLAWVELRKARQDAPYTRMKRQHFQPYGVCRCRAYHFCPGGPRGKPGESSPSSLTELSGAPGLNGLPGQQGVSGYPGVAGTIPHDYYYRYPGCRVCPYGPKGGVGGVGPKGPAVNFFHRVKSIFRVSPACQELTVCQENKV